MTLEEGNHICRLEYVSEFFLSLREAYAEMKKALGTAEARKGYDRCIFHLIDEYLKALTNRFISVEEFTSLINGIADWRKATETVIMGENQQETEALHLPQGDSEIKPKGAQATAAQEHREFRVGCLIVPKDLDTLPLLSPKSTFIAPDTIDLRDYCLETKNQETLPWCAAFATEGFAGNILWRKNDVPYDFNVRDIYAYAKSVDGNPDTEGTSLVAALQWLLYAKVFDASRCGVRVLRTMNQIKYAIHKFGCCLVGLTVSQEWYGCNKNKSTISGRKDRELLGGHAVLCCGYNRDGVIIQNSWGVEWGDYGFALITWQEFDREFVYGAVIDNCLENIRMN